MTVLFGANIVPTCSAPSIPMVSIPFMKAGGRSQSSFSMGQTPVTNAQYGAIVNNLGSARFFVTAINPHISRPVLVARGDSLKDLRLVSLSNAIESLRYWGVAVDQRSMPALIMDGLKIFEVREYRPLKDFDGDNQPAVMIDWYGAFVFTELLRLMTNRLYSLPSTAQWDLAAGVSGDERFPTATGELNPGLAHYAYDGAEMYTVDVDDPRYPSMPNGLRHMAGNVWEWTMTDHTDPSRNGPGREASKKLRGGSWREHYEWLTSHGINNFDKVTHAGDNIGFRVVIN